MLNRLLWLPSQTFSAVFFGLAVFHSVALFFCILLHFWRYFPTSHLAHIFLVVFAEMHWWFTALVRRSYCSDFILIQENRFDIIGSKSCHFCVWDEFLAIEKACILFAVFIARIFLRFIFLPLYQACYQDIYTFSTHMMSYLPSTVSYYVINHKASFGTLIPWV